MKRLPWVLAVTLGACTTDAPQDYLSAELTSATIELQGTQIASLAIDATMTGPILVGTPLLSSGNIVTLDWDNLTDLELTTGDQAWSAGAPIYLVDTRHLAPPALVAACGTTVQLQVVLGGEMASDGHVESETNVIAAPVQCFQ